MYGPASGWTECYRGTSLIRNNPLLGTYSRTVSRALWWPEEGGVFLMSEVPLQGLARLLIREVPL